MWFAERYGWTPAQVDEIPGWLEDAFPLISGVIDEAKAKAREVG